MGQSTGSSLTCSSKSYLPSSDSVEEIFRRIDNMDSMLYSHFTDITINRLAFDDCKELKDKIQYFDLYLHDFNFSYFTVEFHLMLSNSFRNHLSYVNSLRQEFSNKTAIIESLADYR